MEPRLKETIKKEIQPILKEKFGYKNLYMGPKISKVVLNMAIKFGGSSIKDFKKVDGKLGNFQQNFKVYGKGSTACPRRGCSGIIQKIFISNRSTYYCPKCQK